MNIFHYHPETLEYLGKGLADPDPLSPGKYLLPAFSTTTRPSVTPSATQRLLFNKEAHTWELVDKTTEEVTEDLEQIADRVRGERLLALSQSDLKVLRCYETGQPVPPEWVAYRQALRDITEQPGFPLDVVWPTEPGGN